MNTAKMRLVRAPRHEAVHWGIDQLGVRRGDRILAIGLDREALDYVSDKIGWGLVVSIYGLEAAADVSYEFDRAIAVNAVRIWDNPVEALRPLRDVIEPGGRVAVALDLPGANEREARRRGVDLLVALTEAGFADSYVELRETFVGHAVCVLATS